MQEKLPVAGHAGGNFSVFSLINCFFNLSSKKSPMVYIHYFSAYIN